MSKINDIQAKSFPRDTRLLQQTGELIESRIIGSYAPVSPPITSQGPVVCIGSCFAEELAKSLDRNGRAVAPLFLSERWNTTYAVRHFIEFVLTGKSFPDGFLLERTPNADIGAAFEGASSFILTFGLSTCWYEIDTGRMVMDVPLRRGADILSKYEMRQTSVEQNIEQISAIIDLIRLKSVAPIILTLSPVPLLLSATDYPPIVSNALSKSCLRIALFEIERHKLSGVYYWPSFEIVEWLSKYCGPLWGIDDDDLRHIQPSVIDDIMSLFERMFFRNTATPQ